MQVGSYSGESYLSAFTPWRLVSHNNNCPVLKAGHSSVNFILVNLIFIRIYNLMSVFVCMRFFQAIAAGCLSLCILVQLLHVIVYTCILLLSLLSTAVSAFTISLS